MSADKPPHAQTDKSPPRAGLAVGTIGVLLLIVLLCGILLRNAADQPPSPHNQSNLTSVQVEPQFADGDQGEPDGEQQPNGEQQPDATKPAEQSAQGDPLSPPPGDGESETSLDDSPAATDPPPADDSMAAAQPARGTPLATLKPMENDGIQLGADGLWQPVTFVGRRYEQALRVAPASGDSSSQISFSLAGNFAQLSGIAGLQDVPNRDQGSESDQPAAVFRIYGDANLLWDSEPLTAAGVTEKFQLDVTGLDSLSLVVENSSRTDGSQPAWADLQLVPAADSDSEPSDNVGEP